MPDYGYGLHQMGICRWYPCVRRLDQHWVNNRKYVVTRTTLGVTFDLDTGEFYFPTKPDHDQYIPKKYSSMFGWNFRHGGIQYDNHPDNYMYAIQRHCARKEQKNDADCPEVDIFGVVDNLDELLENNSREFRRTQCREWVVATQLGIGDFYIDRGLQEGAKEIITYPHPKQKLRIAAYEKMVLTGTISRILPNPTLRWNIKYLEIAKPRKPPRIIVDCSTENSLSRVYFANSFKSHCKYKRVIYGSVVCMYSPDTDPLTLTDSVTWLFTKESGFKVKILFSSDDACMAIFGDDAPPIFGNVDIVSNDSLHNTHTMMDYIDLSNMPDDYARNLLAITEGKIVLTNPFNIYERVYMRVRGRLLPSGIGDTTQCCNNVYFKIGFGIDRLGDYSVYGAFRAARNCGFRISFDVVDKYSVQFLKHSFVGQYMLPNLGILLRYSGRIEGDVPIFEKAEKRGFDRFAYCQSLLTYGYFKVVRYRPLMRLCPYFDYLNRNETEVDDFYEHRQRRIDYRGSFSYTPTKQQFYSRYNVESFEIDEFESLVNRHDKFLMVDCSLTRKVLLKDYGI